MYVLTYKYQPCPGVYRVSRSLTPPVRPFVRSHPAQPCMQPHNVKIFSIKPLYCLRLIPEMQDMGENVAAAAVVVLSLAKAPSLCATQHKRQQQQQQRRTSRSYCCLAFFAFLLLHLSCRLVFPSLCIGTVGIAITVQHSYHSTDYT